MNASTVFHEISLLTVCIAILMDEPDLIWIALVLLFASVALKENKR